MYRPSNFRPDHRHLRSEPISWSWATTVLPASHRCGSKGAADYCHLGESIRGQTRHLDNPSRSFALEPAGPAVDRARGLPSVWSLSPKTEEARQLQVTTFLRPLRTSRQPSRSPLKAPVCISRQYLYPQPRHSQARTVHLVADVQGDEQGGEGLDDAGVLQLAAVDGANAGDLHRQV